LELPYWFQGAAVLALLKDAGAPLRGWPLAILDSVARGGSAGAGWDEGTAACGSNQGTAVMAERITQLAAEPPMARRDG